MFAATCESPKRPLSVGDLTEENASEDDKPLDSVALAKFLSKAATVTNFYKCAVLHIHCCIT